MRRMISRWFPIALSALALAGCATPDPLAGLASDPLANDGQVYDLTVFPYDIGAASFVMCLEPCSRETLGDELSVIRPADPARFRWATGQTAHQVRVRFIADCFQPDALCGHTPYIFEELPAATVPDLGGWTLASDVSALSQTGLNARSVEALRGNLGYAQHTAEYRQLQEAISGLKNFRLRKVYYEVGINRYQSFYSAWGLQDGRCVHLQVSLRKPLEQKSCDAIPGRLVDIPLGEGAGFGSDDTIVADVTLDYDAVHRVIGVNPAHLICTSTPCPEDPLPPGLRVEL